MLLLLLPLGGLLAAVAARAAKAAALAVAAAWGEPSLVSIASSSPQLLRGVWRPLLLLPLGDALPEPLPLPLAAAAAAAAAAEPPNSGSDPGHSARRVLPAPEAGSLSAAGVVAAAALAGWLGELSWAASRRASNSPLKSMSA